MLRSFTLFAAAGLAASALALAVPITGHAAGTAGGTCSNGAQHTGPGHHSFTESHNNCVEFSDPSQTAFLNNSNSNFILFDTNTPNNAVKDFKNSNNNYVEFQSGATGNTLQSNGSNGNTVAFCAANNCPTAALNDFVTLDQVNGDNVVVFGSGGFVNVVDDGGGPDTCNVNGSLFTSAGGFSKSNPGIVVC